VEEDLGLSLALREAQMMVALTAQTSENRTLRELLAWAADHLTEDLSVDSLARRAAMSERNFSRVFTLEVGEALIVAFSSFITGHGASPSTQPALFVRVASLCGDMNQGCRISGPAITRSLSTPTRYTMFWLTT